MARAHRVDLRTVCKIGTIADARAFTPVDLAEVAALSKADARGIVMRLKRRRLLVQLGIRYFPTRKGWNLIDRACKIVGRRG